MAVLKDSGTIDQLPISADACRRLYFHAYWTCVGHGDFPPCIPAPLTVLLDILDMARKIRDATLDTREARGKLKPRGKPYWRTIERGLHLGYRRLKGKAGTWWARHYLGDQDYEVESIGVADD